MVRGGAAGKETQSGMQFMAGTSQGIVLNKEDNWVDRGWTEGGWVYQRRPGSKSGRKQRPISGGSSLLEQILESGVSSQHYDSLILLFTTPNTTANHS